MFREKERPIKFKEFDTLSSGYYDEPVLWQAQSRLHSDSDKKEIFPRINLIAY